MDIAVSPAPQDHIFVSLGVPLVVFEGSVQVDLNALSLAVFLFAKLMESLCYQPPLPFFFVP